MFAYCLNNPIRRKDVGGATSVDIFDNEFDLTDNDKEFGNGNVSNSGPSGNGNSTPGSQINGTGGDGSKATPFTGGSYSAGQFRANTPGSNPNYTPPNGGGGATSSITVDSVRVSFGHGGRHIDQTSYNYQDIQEAIAHDVVNQPRLPDCTKNVIITYDSRSLLYSYHYFNQYYVSVGTYYFM